MRGPYPKKRGIGYTRKAGSKRARRKLFTQARTAMNAEYVRMWNIFHPVEQGNPEK